jgi:Na+-transporting methylmalonyl-CoA/oxaloacetate decarboxylase gamma subunit
MTESLSNALVITVIGMGLVFGAIIVLWGVMAILVRVTGTPADEPDHTSVETDRKRRAAVAAVALALARQSSTSEPSEFPLPPTALVSAWQAVMRTRMLSKRGRMK